MVKAGRLIITALALAIGAERASAQTKDQTPDIVVSGQTQKALDQFFKAAAPTRNGNQIARWDERLCSEVVNVGPSISQFIRNKIYDTAKHYNLSVEYSGKCDPNIAIIFTDDSDILTKEIFSQYSREYVDAEQHFLSTEGIREAKAPRAVRWLAIDGYPATSLDKGIPSRIHTQAHRIIGSSLIIVDIKRIDGIQWGQLGAYIAMIALTDPKLGSNFSGQDSILSLFDDGAAKAPKDLTAQDRLLISTLYASDSYQSASEQRSEMHRIQKRAQKRGVAP